MVISPFVIAASINHTATIIFLHGLGDTGLGWSELMKDIREPYMKIICPTANTMPVSLNDGYEMPSWFDLHGLDESAAEDVRGLNNSAIYVHSLILQEIVGGIPSDRIIVGGFSQGGTLALHSGLTFPKKLAGIIALSCWLRMSETLSPSSVTVNKDIPILQCHGDHDTTVRYKFGQTTASTLKNFSKNVDFRTYRGLAHSTTDEEMNDIKTFIKNRLPPV